MERKEGIKEGRMREREMQREGTEREKGKNEGEIEL